MARLLSRRPRAPTRDLPSRSCWDVSPRASLRSDFARLRLFSVLLSYFEAPGFLERDRNGLPPALDLAAFPFRAALELAMRELVHDTAEGLSLSGGCLRHGYLRFVLNIVGIRQPTSKRFAWFPLQGAQPRVARRLMIRKNA